MYGIAFLKYNFDIPSDNQDEFLLGGQGRPAECVGEWIDRLVGSFGGIACVLFLLLLVRVVAVVVLRLDWLAVPGTDRR